MSLTTPETIAKRHTEAYEPEYYATLYRQMRYAFGEPWNKGWGGVSGAGGSSEFPDFPDVTVRYLEPGASRRILNTQFISMSRTMYTTPEAESPDVDRYTAEVRKQFILERSRGNMSADGEWEDEFNACQVEGDAIGISFVQVGLEDNPLTGYQRVAIRHSPTIQTLWDRVNRQISRSRFVTFVHYMPLDVAEGVFGSKLAKDRMSVLYDSTTSKGLEVVRVFEYFDIGVGGGDPTRSIQLQSMSSEPVHIEANSFECLPFGYYIHFHAPGMRRPIGRVVMQQPTQEAINEIERRIRQTIARQQGATILDADQLDPGDLRKFYRGETQVIKIVNPKPGQPPFYNVPAGEVSRTLLEQWQMLDRQFNTDSGTTESEQNNLSSTQRTLGENQLVDQRSEPPRNWSRKQVAKLYVRTFETVLKVAGKFDRDPLMVDVFGHQIPINVPGNPASSMEAFTSEPSKILVDEQSLRAKDARQDRLDELAMLGQLAPEVQAGLVNPQTFVKRKLEILGEKDVAEWAPQQIQQDAMAGGAVPQQVGAAPVAGA